MNAAYLLQSAWRELDAVRMDRDSLRNTLAAIEEKGHFKADSEFWLQEVCRMAHEALQKSVAK